MSRGTRDRIKERPDDFETRRQSLSGLSDDELRERFWTVAGEIVAPLFELARGHTSPSIERSVLLRMGFSSLEAKEIVDRVVHEGLLGYGAGHIVLRARDIEGTDTRSAGQALLEGRLWDRIRKDLTGGGGEGR